MSYLVRKITRAKWEGGDDFASDEIPADAVTADLRTNSNTLSFWKLEMPSYDKICMTALALVTAADRIDPMDLAWVERNSISAHGILISPSDGLTPVASLRGNHVDVTKLDLGRLSRIARFISEALSRDQHRRFTRKELIQIIVDAVRKKILSIDDLKPKVKEEIEKKLGN